MKGHALNTTKQSFPPLDIRLLESGHIQFDDPSFEGSVVHVHPAQLQVAAQLIEFTLPDRARKALGRVLERVKALSEQASELQGLLELALVEGQGVGAELVACRFIATNLGQVAQDLEDLSAPDLEPQPDAASTPGGQLVLV